MKGHFLFLLLSGALLILIALSPDSRAEEWVVDEKGEGNFTELEDAMDVAEQGDLILVKAGNYSLLEFKFNFGVSVQGEGSEQTRVFLTPPAFYRSVHYSNVSFSGLNFTSGTQESYQNMIVWGSGLRNLSFQNCSFFNIGRGVGGVVSYGGIEFNNNSLWETPLVFNSFFVSNMEMSSFHNVSIDGKPLMLLVSQQNLTLKDQEPGHLHIINCSNIQIRNFTLINAKLELDFSQDIWIQNSTIEIPEGQEMDLSRCTGVHIQDCDISLKREEFSSHWILMETRYCNGLVLERNRVSGGRIQLESSSGILVQNNRFGDNGSLQLDSCPAAIILNNSFQNYGMIFNFYDVLQSPKRMENNTLAGSPIRYYLNQSGVVVEGDTGQLLMVNCSEILIQGMSGQDMGDCYLLGCRNVTVRNSSCQSTVGIFLVHDCEGVEIHNSSFAPFPLRVGFSNQVLVNNSHITGYMTAVLFRNVENGSVTLCRLNDSHVGLVLSQTHESLITGNEFLDNHYGIELYNVNNNSIRENLISENEIGIYLNRDCDDNKINQNNIFGNRDFALDERDCGGSGGNSTLNWWGHSSGPFHIDENHNGNGDNVTRGAYIDPWLTGPLALTTWTDLNKEEPSPETDSKDRKEQDSWSMYCLFLPILLSVLLGVAWMSWKKAQGQVKETEKQETPDTGPPSIVNSCPHCGEKFEIGNPKRPLKLNCPFCKEEVVLE